MSGYTIGEIAGWLVLASVLGFVLGWLVRELQARARRPAGRPAVVEAPVEPSDPVDEPEDRPLIKGNTRSKIFHTPESPSYARTTAGVWFRTEAEAEEAGYRKAGATTRKAPAAGPKDS